MYNQFQFFAIVFGDHELSFIWEVCRKRFALQLFNDLYQGTFLVLEVQTIL